MAVTDYQLGVANESTYGTPVTVTRFFEFESEGIEENEGRTAGDPLRLGSGFARNDRWVPYFAGASGPLQLTAMTKGFGFWLRHLLGTSVTTGPAETVVFTHTGTEGDLLGDSFTLQIGKPFAPSGTVQAFTYAGGKVTNWTISNSVDKNLILDLGLDFMQVATATALASAAYPTGMEPFSWATGLVTIGGSNYDITEFSLQVDNGYNVDRRQIRRNTDKKEPLSGTRSAQFSISADFDTITQRNRAHGSVRSDSLAAITAQWRGPVLLGTTIFPEFNITIPAARFDKWTAPSTKTDGISQTLTGEVEYDGSASPITLTLKNADATA